MPCDQIILNQVNLNLADWQTLVQAIRNFADRVTYVNDNVKTLSFIKNGISYSIANGKLSCPKGYEGTADLVKQSYSRVVLAKAASRFGWNVNTTKQDNKLKLTRRY